MTSPRRGASQRNPLSPPQGRRLDVDKWVGGRYAADLSLKGELCSLVAQLSFCYPPYGEKAPILSRYHFHSFLVGSSFLTAPGMHNANIASPRLRDSLAICHRLVHLPATGPETFCHQNETGQRFGAHFSHKAAPMNLHCLFGYPDPSRDLLVHKAARHQCHNLALAGT